MNVPRLGDRHGRISGYALGGVVAERAEAGPKALHFSGGGTMPVYACGIYNEPDRTYVFPNPPSGGGGRTIVFNNYNYGAVMGVDDLIRKTASAISAADSEAATIHYTEQGGTPCDHGAASRNGPASSPAAHSGRGDCPRSQG